MRLEFFQGDELERGGVRRFEIHFPGQSALQRSLPPRHTDAPFIAWFEPGEMIFRPRRDQVVAVEHREVEEVPIPLHTDSVQADVLRPGAAIAVPIEPRQRIATAAFQFGPEDVCWHDAQVTLFVRATHVPLRRSKEAAAFDFIDVKDDDHKLAFWLLPAAQAGDFFRSLVPDLAARYDAPEFQPHLTLVGGEFDDAFDFRRVETSEMRAIELEVDNIQHSEKYTKTLFVRFKPNPELSALRESIAQLLGQENEGDFDPHVSLMYKTLPAEEKAELARTLKLPFDRVRFDVIKAVKTPAKIESPEGVHAWRTIWERPLPL